MPCRFCGGDDGDGHLFGDCTFPPQVEIREHPEFHDLIVVGQVLLASVSLLALVVAIAFWGESWFFLGGGSR